MPAPLYEIERETLIAAVRELDSRGLVSGSSGNVSLRLPFEGGDERYLITPAGVTYDLLDAAGLVVVDGELEPVGAELVPSTESLLHLGIYRNRPDVNAIVHTHSLFASVAAVTSTHIPPIVDEMVVYIGGPIEVADYGFPGTPELAAAGVEALGDRRAVLLRNHGMCAVAPTLAEAMRVAVLVERVAQIYVHAETIGGATELPEFAVDAERQVYLMRSGLAGTD
ncbi:MAG: class II aldolase/adducin family protein [Chloroflexi bacterium]|nr:class II aldolase/adducin family protein [Chloroflexota bacterium]MDA1296538.1 class II aldolase/adducin family protein [Chloroflexota bacterium]